jgi:arylamine N-acetyltransferase
MTALLDFLNYYRIPQDAPHRMLLDRLVVEFAKLPYENITKIIKRAEAGSDEKARRYPEEVIRDHINWGAGGTCFSLTSALAHLVRGLGWKAEYILADRNYGQNTHCALLVWIDDVPHLLDPGFLIVNPIPLPDGRPEEIRTAFNGLILVPEERQNRVLLSTVRNGSLTYRLTYKISPVDEEEFLKAWDASFGWDMMRYPLLTRTETSKQFYLNGSRLQISNADFIEKRKILADELVPRIAAEFHIHPSVVAHAVSILKDKGEMGGKTSKR